MMTAEQLKGAILQYAIEGKLVPQKREDVSVGELLNKCFQDKKKAIQEGKYKKEKYLGALPREEYPFEIPDNWRFVHISDMALFQEGPGILAKDFRNTGVPLIRIAGMRSDIVSQEGCNYLDPKMVEEKWSHFKLDLGDVVISSSASMDKIAEVGIETVGCIVYTGLIRFKMYGGIDKNFFKIFIKSPFYQRQIIEQAAGAAIKHYGPSHLRKMVIPIPPVEEQKRIVAKIEELMPFVEQYAAASTKLNTLNALFPEMMKKSILQEAVQGKLVTQDPNDEPASLLLKKIAEEKKRLIKEGKIKKQKPLPEITEDEIPFDIPESWEWTRLAEISTVITGGTPSKTHPEYYGGEFPFYKPADIQSYKYICNASEDLSMEGMKKARFIPKGSIAVNCIGNIGKSAIMPKDGTTNQQINSICYYPFPDYIYWFCQATVFISQIRNKASMTTIPIVNKSKMEEILVPIPPLNEQKRIVKKVEDIMPIIDGLRY